MQYDVQERHNAVQSLSGSLVEIQRSEDSMRTEKDICGQMLVNKDGKTLVCQRNKHTIWPSAKHWDDRDGWHGWSEAFAEQQRKQQAGK